MDALKIIVSFLTSACTRKTGALAVRGRRASRSDTHAASQSFERMHNTLRVRVKVRVRTPLIQHERITQACGESVLADSQRVRSLMAVFCTSTILITNTNRMRTTPKYDYLKIPQHSSNTTRVQTYTSKFTLGDSQRMLAFILDLCKKSINKHA